MHRDAGNKRVIFQLDPLQGKGRELFRHPLAQADADISPDAKRFAYLVPGGKANRIAFVNASGQLEREVEVEGWAGINAMDWSADGKGLFVGVFNPATGATLLYVDLAGKATSLWNQPGSFRTWGHPIARRPLRRNADRDYRQQCVDCRELLSVAARRAAGAESDSIDAVQNRRERRRSSRYPRGGRPACGRPITRWPRKDRCCITRKICDALSGVNVSFTPFPHGQDGYRSFALDNPGVLDHRTSRLRKITDRSLSVVWTRPFQGHRRR